MQWAFTLSYSQRHEEAAAAAKESVRHRPTYADGWAVWGQVLAYRSQPEAALEKMARAMALHVRRPSFTRITLAWRTTSTGSYASDAMPQRP